MQKGHTLQFKCLTCSTPVHFSIFELDTQPILPCPGCSKKYAFSDPDLLRQLKKFEGLCRHIHDAEEILGMTSVGIDVGDQHVKVPYKLLLTRLSSNLDLIVGGKPLSVSFRIEPIHDPMIASALSSSLANP
jgi:hypothetical protein